MIEKIIAFFVSIAAIILDGIDAYGMFSANLMKGCVETVISLFGINEASVNLWNIVSMALPGLVFVIWLILNMSPAGRAVREDRKDASIGFGNSLLIKYAKTLLILLCGFVIFADVLGSMLPEIFGGLFGEVQNLMASGMGIIIPLLVIELIVFVILLFDIAFNDFHIGAGGRVMLVGIFMDLLMIVALILNIATKYYVIM